MLIVDLVFPSGFQEIAFIHYFRAVESLWHLRDSERTHAVLHVYIYTPM